MDQLLEKVETYVQEYMAEFDSSHDFSHVQRVVRIAQSLATREKSFDPKIDYRSDLVQLASLLHDVGDRKYLKPGQDGKIMAHDFLLQLGADESLAADVQLLVNNISYTNEVTNPREVQKVLAEYPELAVVQDADRIDAIGAIGIARLFAFGAAVAKIPLDGAVMHMTEKLLKLEGMMKTQSGRELARVRTERIQTYMSWYVEETLG